MRVVDGVAARLKAMPDGRLLKVGFHGRRSSRSAWC
jgi:hypothetical protein